MSEHEYCQENLPQKDDNEIIGHMQSKDGEDLGELVVMNKATNKIRLKQRNIAGTLELVTFVVPSVTIIFH